MALQAHSTLLPDADIAACVDPKLEEAYDKVAAQHLFEKAKECISRESSDRPTMSEVVGFLNAVRSDMERSVMGMQRKVESLGFGASSASSLGPPLIGDSRQTSSSTGKSTSYNFVSEIMERGR